MLVEPFQPTTSIAILNPAWDMEKELSGYSSPLESPIPAPVCHLCLEISIPEETIQAGTNKIISSFIHIPKNQLKSLQPSKVLYLVSSSLPLQWRREMRRESVVDSSHDDLPGLGAFW
jgi:hypothetical protein